MSEQNSYFAVKHILCDFALSLTYRTIWLLWQYITNTFHNPKNLFSSANPLLCQTARMLEYCLFCHFDTACSDRYFWELKIHCRSRNTNRNYIIIILINGLRPLLLTLLFLCMSLPTNNYWVQGATAPLILSHTYTQVDEFLWQQKPVGNGYTSFSHTNGCFHFWRFTV